MRKWLIVAAPVLVILGLALWAAGQAYPSAATGRLLGLAPSGLVVSRWLAEPWRSVQFYRELVSRPQRSSIPAVNLPVSEPREHVGCPFSTRREA